MKKTKCIPLLVFLIAGIGVLATVGCSMPGIGAGATVNLGRAGDFVVLAKTAITNVPSSDITGDVGLSPSARSDLAGFSETLVGTYATSPQVTGRIYAADMTSPTPSEMTTAVSNMEAAYTDAATRVNPAELDLGAGTLSGLTLAPGLYKWGSTVTITTDITLAGGPGGIWIFQISGDLVVASAVQIILSGGARADRIFWQVAGEAVLGTTSRFKGIILCQTAITLETGATLDGRALAQSQVAMDQATVTRP